MNGKKKAIIGIGMATIMLACLAAMVPMGSARTGNEGLKDIAYFLLGLSFLSATLAIAYFVLKMRGKARRRKSKEEEIIETIKEVRELRKKLEEKGENLTSLSDVFSVQVFTLSEIRGVNKSIDDMKSWILLELGLLVAFCLAIMSMLFSIMSIF